MQPINERAQKKERLCCKIKHHISFFSEILELKKKQAYKM